MSRTKRKIPIMGIAGNSDKIGKQLANRIFRKREKLSIQNWDFKKLPLKVRDVYNVWSMPKDGKIYFGNWRFNKDQKIKDRYEKYIRK